MSHKRVGSLKLIRTVAAISMCILLLVACLISGCGNSSESAATSQPAASKQGDASKPTTESITIGTLQTEDFLPMWFAEDKGIFKEKGLEGKVKITVFQSAQELSAALSSGAIDMAMTDIPVAATLSQSGTPMSIAWVTLGSTPSEGRFGIMVGPKSSVKTLAELKGQPVGVGSGTMLEYVMDKLMLKDGFTDDEIKVEELKKLPVRLQMVLEGKVAAGVFPATLLALGESQGGRVIADDTTGENLSQSIMAARTGYLAEPGVKELVDKVAQAWDEAADKIAADPDAAREVLIKNANLPEPIKANYPLQHYPHAALPQETEVSNVLEWMVKKGYVSEKVTYKPVDNRQGNLETSQK